MHRQEHRALLEAAIDDVAAVVGDRGADARVDQVLDLLDDVGVASASSASAKSRVPASITACPGRNLSVAGLGVVSVSISMGATWDGTGAGARGGGV